MSLSTHVLDTATGVPATDVRVDLARAGPGPHAWEAVSSAVTDGDGRAVLLPGVVPAATYRVRFDTGGHDRAQGREGLFPEVSVVVAVRAEVGALHVPLLLSPFGYTTYRGS